MDIISLLPDSVANQIAAGEVIQRPASVVKELVENAVDAGATTIQVIVVDAGRTCIQVIDNGRGMSETDARLSFERHATSKIRQADDLFALHTMGFRGEALASIAAVAQVSLQTRMADEEIGTLITIAGSRVTGQEPVSCPVGSNFKVENLFYNVPARRKFLKSNATELSNIMTAFERIVLVYPEIHFTLHHNGAELMNLRAGNLRQRIVDVCGKQYGQDLLPVEVATALCRIHGFVSKPEAARKKGGADHFFVNGRYMRHPYFHKAVLTAYDRLIPEGMQPPYFLYFDVEPGDIDVNIHPTKTEIKFENEQAIWQILMAAVRDAIGRFCEIPTINFDTVGRPEIPIFNPADSGFSAPQVKYNPDYNPFSAASRQSAPTKGGDGLPDLSPDSEFPEDSEFPGGAGFPGGTGFPGDSSYPSGVGFPDEVSYPRGAGLPGDSEFHGLSGSEAPSATLWGQSSPIDRSPVHYQYKARYIMTAVKSGLMVIDQHRASVRILFERYLAQQQGRLMTTQKLLFPETIQLSPTEAVTFADMQLLLSAQGFDLSDLGGSTWAVNGIPAGLEGIDPVSLLRQLLATALDHDRPTLDLSLSQSLTLSLARSAAVPYGQLLSNDEMEALVNDLFACNNVNYTPDGKAILAILPQTEIDGLFA